MNPLPFRLGGGPTPTDRAYKALRGAVGEGGAGPPGGLEDLWRMVEARAVASAHSTVARAMYQAWPQTMSDHLAIWETIFGIPRAATLPERQAAVKAELTRQLDATIAAMTSELQAIDPNFEIEQMAWDESVTVKLGRAFGPLIGVDGDPYSSGYIDRQSSAWPMFSDGFIIHVLYTLPDGETEIPFASLDRAKNYLADVLPSWVDFTIYNLAHGALGDGFLLDGGDDGDSLLDQTALGA